MAIDITNVLDALQRKISSFDSSGDTFDLQYLLTSALRADRSSTIVYDTQQDLPDLLSDNDFAGQENLAYVRSDETVYFKDYTNRLWKPLPTINSFLGDTSGFTAGGWQPGAVNQIESFSFASDANGASDWGDLSQALYNQIGFSDRGGGFGYSILGTGGTTYIDQFPTVSPGNATDVANLGSNPNPYTDSPIRNNIGAHSYTSGFNFHHENPGVNNVRIDEFPFASNATSSAWPGEIFPSPTLKNEYGESVNDHGSGYAWLTGLNFSPTAPTTDAKRFSYTNAVTASPVRTLIPGIAHVNSNVSSNTHGYHCSGFDGSPPLGDNRVFKFPFALGDADTTATQVGDLASPIYLATSQSSLSAGYITGSADVPAPSTFDIRKIIFSSDTQTAAIVSGLVGNTQQGQGSGHQF